MLLFMKKSHMCKTISIHKDVSTFYVKLLPNTLRAFGGWSDNTKPSHLAVSKSQKGIEVLIRNST